MLFTLTSTILCADFNIILNEFKVRKFCLFLPEWRFGRSRSSEVIDFGANRKRACDFLLVRNSNLGRILHHFGDMTAFMCSWPHLYSIVILGCSRCTRSPTLGSVSAWSLSYSAVKLFSKNSKSNLCEQGTRRPTWSASQTDRLTDAILSQYRAVNSIAREKEIIIPWIRIHDM